MQGKIFFLPNFFCNMFLFFFAGGQHQGGENRVATYPVDFVASFLIDGKCIKINNLWKKSNISAGQEVRKKSGHIFIFVL